jgi:hypothetical protein
MLNEAGKYGGLTYAQMIKKIKQDEKARKAAEKAPSIPTSKETPPTPKPVPAITKSTTDTKPVITTKKGAAGKTGGFALSIGSGSSGPVDPNDKNAVRNARLEKGIKNAIADATPSSDPRSKTIATFAKAEMAKVIAFIRKHFDLPRFDIKMTLVWDGAAAGISAGCDTAAKNPDVFFDFSRYLRNEGDLNQYKWTRPEYETFSSSKVIGDLVKVSWQACVTASLCHEASHALQYTKDIEVLQKVVDALPNYTGNGNDGAHGPLFQAIYTAIRGNIMGTKKESTEMLSFAAYLEEVEKKSKKPLKLSVPIGRHTDIDAVDSTVKKA